MLSCNPSFPCRRAAGGQPAAEPCAEEIVGIFCTHYRKQTPSQPLNAPQEGSLKLSHVLKIAMEVAKGMDYLHQRKIIHRRATK